MRRGLGCIWPRMLWLAPGLNLPSSIDNDAVVREARGLLPWAAGAIAGVSSEDDRSCSRASRWAV